MNKKERLKKAFVIWGLLAVSAFTIYMILNKTGTYLPCPFRTVTGYLCPGCGVTRMLMSIGELDFARAFHYNMAVFLMLPVIIIILISMTVRYVRYNTMRPGRFQEKILILMIIVLILFGILRNVI